MPGSNPGQVTDAEYLLGLGERLGGGPPGWMERVRSGEILMEPLRRWWRERALSCARIYRSPLYDSVKPLPLGGEALFTYERSLWPIPLETGGVGEALVCRSRRAAWWVALLTLQDVLGRPLQIRSRGLCPRLEEWLVGVSERRCQWSPAHSEETLLSSLAGGRADVFILGTRGWDPQRWLTAWRERKTPAVLWIDLEQSPCFPWNIFINSLYPPPALCLLSDSLQGWDSGGLGLPQLGRLRWLGPSSLSGMSLRDNAVELGARVRSVVGAAPSFAELCLWDALQSEAARAAYLERIQRNSQLVSERLGVEVDEAGRYCGCLPGVTKSAGVGEFEPCWDGDLVSVGWRDPLSWLEGRLSRHPRPRQPAWPTRGGRLAWLRCADRREPLSLESLENRLRAYDEGEPLLFASAMAAMATLWTALEMLWPHPPRYLSKARYFESQFLQRVLGIEMTSQVPDVAFFESVEYDWELTPLDPGTSTEATLIVLDTTLTAGRLRLTDLPPSLLKIRLFSGLKLDQRGWEMENCGAMLVTGRPDLVATLVERLRWQRQHSGTELSELQRRRLSIPWILDGDPVHAERVFAHNLRLAQSLPVGGLVRRLVHPDSGAPFVVLHLCEESIESHQLLAAALDYEARRQRLPLARGASFGFEDHRFEFVIPVLRENRALFKIALGSRGGPELDRVIRAVCKVLKHADFSALRAAYPGLPLAPPARDWAAPSQRMLDYLAELD